MQLLCSFIGLAVRFAVLYLVLYAFLSTVLSVVLKCCSMLLNDILGLVLRPVIRATQCCLTVLSYCVFFITRFTVYTVGKYMMMNFLVGRNDLH